MSTSKTFGDVDARSRARRHDPREAHAATARRGDGGRDVYEPYKD